MEKMPFLPCFTCSKEFKNIEALKQHKKDMVHVRGPTMGEEWTQLQALEIYFTAYYEEQVMIMRTDRRKSRRAVLDVIKEIREDFQDEKGADLYKTTVHYAGSTATQTKVHLADEFDFNFKIDIKENDLEVSTEGEDMWFEVEEGDDSESNHLSEKWTIEKRKRPLHIPPGYATVSVTDPSYYKDNSWWSRVTHKRDNSWWSNKEKNKNKNKRFLIPRFVQEDLYEKASISMRDKRPGGLKVIACL